MPRNDRGTENDRAKYSQDIPKFSGTIADEAIRDNENGGVSSGSASDHADAVGPSIRNRRKR